MSIISYFISSYLKTLTMNIYSLYTALCEVFAKYATLIFISFIFMLFKCSL